MVALTTQQAAAITGRNRSTIWRAIKTGRVSATRTATGDYLVEPVELERAFGLLQRRHDALRPRATGRRAPVSGAEVAWLRERVAALEADKADLRLERDRLLGVIEQQSEQMRRLGDRRAGAGFWRRLLGRAGAP
jgi:hypothetical protein